MRPTAKRFLRIALGVVLLGFVAWRLQFPSSVSSEFATVSWRNLVGKPGRVVIAVRDQQGRPVPNHAVTSESDSGRAVDSTGQPFRTDATGVVSFAPGESEIVAVWIGPHRFRLRRGLGELFFAPTCVTGIQFDAKLK